MNINTSIVSDHPCYDDSSKDLVTLIVAEGSDFHNLLSTLPGVSGLMTSDKYQDRLQECVQEIIRGPRQKRALAETMFVGVSSALFTFVSNRDLSNKMEKLRDNIRIEQKAGADWRMGAVNTMEILKRYSTRTQETLVNITCINELRFSLTEYLFQLQSYYTRMRDMVVMAMNNQLSRDLITLSDLISSVLTKDGLQNTIYINNPHLFYLLSNVFITHYNSTSQTLSFTLSIPQIEPDDVSMLYRIYNYGWQEDGIRYSLPEEYFTIFDTVNKLFVEASKSLCRSVGTLELCDTGSYIHSSKSSCLQSIFDNNTRNENCEILASKIDILDQVIPLRAGVLVYGEKIIEQGITIRGYPTVQHKTRQGRSDIGFYKYKTGNFIKVDSTYYKEKTNAEDIIIISRAPIYHIKSEINLQVLGKEFQEDTLKHLDVKIQKLKEDTLNYYRHEYLPSPGNMDIITVVFMLVIFIGVSIGILAYTYGAIRDKYQRM